MKLRRINFFQKYLHAQCLYPTFKSSTLYSRQPSACQFIQTQSDSSTETTRAIVNLIRKGNFSPTFNTYSKLLTQCSSTKSVKEGKEIHAHLMKFGFGNEITLRNHLITFYITCQRFGYADIVFDQIAKPNSVSWSSMISGYVKNGFDKKALCAFNEMCNSGVECNEFTFTSVLKACSIVKDLSGGKQIHGVVGKTGFMSDVYVTNTLVCLYAKCSELRDSQRLFDEITTRNVVTWNALFSSFVQNECCGEAITLFGQMVLSDLKPNEFSLSTIVKACTGLKDYDQGRRVHGYLIRLGYGSDSYSANALVDMYAKVGDLESAINIFEKIAHTDTVSWNAIIAGCVSHNYHDFALELFVDMKGSGQIPNMFTLSSILKACAGLKLNDLGRQIHSSLIKMNSECDLVVSVGLLSAYSSCNLIEDAMLIFRSIQEPDSVAWNAVISGYSHNNDHKKAVSIFADMHKEGPRFNQTTLSTVLKSTAFLEMKDMVKQVHALSVKSGIDSDNYVANSLIDSYGKCDLVDEATKIFNTCPCGDVVSFTSLVKGYIQCGQCEEALKLFPKMLNTGLKLDPFACSSLINACANISAYEQGKQVHVHVLKLGLAFDIFAGSSLVNMYAKCGSIEDAKRTFSKISRKAIVSWSAMINGLARHGHGREALDVFNQMVEDGVPPNSITLVSVLCACNHAGLVMEAKQYFESMEEVYGIKPIAEHYGCMIDILGRAGRLDEAMELADSMPFEENAAAWGSVLGASKTHKNIEFGRHAAEKLFILEPEKSGTHVLLANMYAAAGKWDGVAEVRRLMKTNKVKKEPGISWIEIKDEVHTFVVGDRNHSRKEEIYAKLEELSILLEKAGYVPMVEIDLHNVEQNEKEILLKQHSERLAVAFGLIATPEGAPIRVKKNLRVCVDCHTVLKFICKIVSREIVVRDINRFHHFKDGACSCGDYW